MYGRNTGRIRRLFWFLAVTVWLTGGTIEASASGENRVYRIGAYENLYPMVYEDGESGEAEGIVPELVELLQKRTGYTFEFVLCSNLINIKTMAATGEIDFFMESGDSYIPVSGAERSESILELPMAIVKEDERQDLYEGVLATIEEMSMSPAIQDADEVRYYSTFLDCLDAVRRGEADYSYGCSWVFEPYMKDPAYQKLMLVSMGQSSTLRLTAASEEAKGILKSLNAGIRGISAADTEGIVYRNLIAYQYKMSPGRAVFVYAPWILAATVLLAVIVILFIMQHWRMKVQMQKEITLRALDEEAKYRVASEISNDILFEYDIRKDLMVMSLRFREIYGRNWIMPEFLEERKELAYIHEEDISVYEKFLDDLISGKEMMEAEFRMQGPTGNYIWGHLRGKTIYDGDKEPVRVIGKIVNIDLHKKELERLQYKAQRDPFTGVYNKETFMEMVQDCLDCVRDTQDQYAMIVIDIDNFKQFNDRHGHLYGDQVLKKLVSRIRESFRSSDLIGRIGGDEFAVFLKVSSQKDAAARLDGLMERIHNSVQVEEKELNMTVSMGVSLTHSNTDYNTLFGEADNALYEVKNKGKDSYAFSGKEEYGFFS